MTRAAQKLLTPELYKETLQTSKPVRAVNTRITSENHVLKTVTANKISLSAFYDKRYICGDGLRTLPYGHFSVVTDNQSKTSSSHAWFDPDQSLISWDFSTENSDNLSEIFCDTEVDWDFPIYLPPPDKRMRKHFSNNLNLLLDSASHYSPSEPGFIDAGGIRDGDISHDEIVDFDRSSSEEEQSFCSFIDLEATENSREQ